MLELLSPAGSMDALRAAVQNGADAVYLGAGGFNARMGARNFTNDELAEAVRYCHVRGVQVHFTLNTLALDRELDEAAQLIVRAAQCGVDAFIVQDLGLVSLCRELAPGIPVHASTQMSVHSLAGVLQAAAMGCSRVVLARELPRGEIAHICRSSPVEIEIFGHGALCMSYSGQCYFSGVIGRRSGNRGACAQPCRLCYGYGRFEPKYPLSLKDNCLLPYVEDMKKIGVASVKIEGRMKRPEYVAIATRVWRRAIDGQAPTEQDMDELTRAFSRDGFTRGYYEARLGRSMFGIHRDGLDERELFARARRSYEGAEQPRVQVSFRVEARREQPLRLLCTDQSGREAEVTGPVPENARERAVTTEEITERLSRTGGTPYRVERCQVQLDPGLSISAANLNTLRREALSRLTALRGRPAPFTPGPLTRPPHFPGTDEAPEITVSVRTWEQLTDTLLSCSPQVLYVPLPLICEHPELPERLHPGTRLCAALPRIVWDSERDKLRALLREAARLGVGEALCGTIGHIALLRSLKGEDFLLRGDYGLNLFNSRTAAWLSAQGLRSVTASFEMTLPQLRDLSKPVPTEILAYGRLPLMLTENCVIRNRTGACACDISTRLYDRKGEGFPVLRETGSCRSEIFNSKKLYLLDKLPQLAGLGLWALRLSFTTENPAEVDAVLRGMAAGGAFDPGTCTRGLYIRGVQ